MGYTITNNVMYVRDDTGQFLPVMAVGAGADQTLQAIRDAASAAETEVDAKVSDALARIPEVTALAGDVGVLMDDAMILCEASALGIGGLGTSDGTTATSTTRCYTKYYMPLEGAQIAIQPGQKITLRFYAADKTYMGYTGWMETAAEAMEALRASGAYFYRAALAYTDDRTIASADAFAGAVRSRRPRCAEYDAAFALGELLSGTSSETYRSTTHIPVSRGETVQYDVSMLGTVAYFRFYGADGVLREELKSDPTRTQYSGLYTAGEDGYVRACSMGENHSKYQREGLLRILTDAGRHIRQEVEAAQTEAVTARTTAAKEATLSILAAKSFAYNDGCIPVIDWYLLIDPATNSFYMSKDLKHKKYLFTFNGDNSNPHRYKFGILQNGDIIAVYRTEFEDAGSTYGPELDNVRKNPYVFLASENYAAAHLVDFGDGLKPSGWLQNVGFCTLPDGSVIFCEYTRMGVVYTANCWRIAAGANLLDPANWVIVKQFLVAQDDQVAFDESYIEHFHAAQYDPYGKTLYITTGDLDNKAQIWYSKDYGLSFTQQRFLARIEGSEDYAYATSGQREFRLLNFTWEKDYVYWISDSASYRSVMRCTRNAQGVLNEDGLTYLLDIPYNENGYPATYGQAYLPEHRLLVLMERCDEYGATTMEFRAFDLDTNTLKPLATLSAIGNPGPKDMATLIGFRTEYTEFDPIDGFIKCGFGGRWEYRNRIALFDNVVSANWKDMVNNLSIRVWKNSDGTLGCRFGVYYL